MGSACKILEATPTLLATPICTHGLRSSLRQCWHSWLKSHYVTIEAPGRTRLLTGQAQNYCSSMHSKGTYICIWPPAPVLGILLPESGVHSNPMNPSGSPLSTKKNKTHTQTTNTSKWKLGTKEPYYHLTARDKQLPIIISLSPHNTAEINKHNETSTKQMKLSKWKPRDQRSHIMEPSRSLRKTKGYEWRDFSVAPVEMKW